MVARSRRMVVLKPSIAALAGQSGAQTGWRDGGEDRQAGRLHLGCGPDHSSDPLDQERRAGTRARVRRARLRTGVRIAVSSPALVAEEAGAITAPGGDLAVLECGPLGAQADQLVAQGVGQLCLEGPLGGAALLGGGGGGAEVR